MACERFAGKRVLVTGAAAGIGRAVAGRFAAEGAALVLADHDEEGLVRASVALAARGARVESHVYDAMERGGAEALVAAMGGRIDCLVNIAGIYHRAHFRDLRDEDWDRVLRVNLTSVAELCRAALPGLVESRGAIVNTASTAGLRGIAYAAPYAVSKAGIIALTKSLAAEFGHEGVRVNAVAPGRVVTEIGKHLAPLENARPELSAFPSKLAGLVEGAPPELLAGAYLWLASEDAAYVSGTIHEVDGGYLVG